MKIALLGPAWPYRGGIAAFNERLAREFLAEGHEVEIFTFTLQYPGFLFPGKTQYSEDPEPKGLKISRSLSSISPASWRRTASDIVGSGAGILVIHFWMPYMAPSMGRVAKLVRKKGVKVVCVAHNLTPHESRPGDGLLLKYFCSGVDGFIAMSRTVCEDAKRLAPRKPCILNAHPVYDIYGDPVPKEVACKRIGVDPSKKTLLFFGLIRDYKGLDLLLEAYAPLSDVCTLIVAGEFYSDSEKYHKLAEELGIEDKVVWKTEFVPDNMVRYYFSAADLVVQPYRSATQSGVTQIAYHFEKPMAVTNVGGLAEMVPDGKAGYVVKPEADSVRAAIADFIEREPSFSKGIKSEKKKYSWKAITDSILKIIQ